MRVHPCVALLVLSISAFGLLVGCSGTGGIGNTGGLGGNYGAAGDFGATQGGVQDMGFARELIAQGQVPPAEAFVVEGMFSEHDLPLQGETPDRLLVLRTAVGWAPTLAGADAAWLQVGMSSTIDPETYQRSDVSLIATVDVSGSMFWNYGGDQEEPMTPIAFAKDLLKRMATELTAADQFALVTYGTDVSTVMNFTSGDQHDLITSTVDGLSENGSTNMEAGLERAFSLAGQGQGGRVKRVILFTDVQPNVGATGATDFEQMATDAAGNGVGLTVIGVGVGLGSEVFEAMSHLRGGNAFTLMDEEDITDTMAQDWPWMLEPIAYDLNVALTPGPGFSVTAGYGFPSSDTGEPELSLTASSVFLSQKRGALLVQLSADQDTLAFTDLTATGTLSYETPEGETVSQDVVVDASGFTVGEDGRFFEQPSVEECVALALLVDGMKTASEQYGESHEQAIATMEQVVARFEADIATIEDTSPDDVTMDTELQLARRLLQLMRDGAEQGDLYGQTA